MRSNCIKPSPICQAKVATPSSASGVNNAETVWREDLHVTMVLPTKTNTQFWLRLSFPANDASPKMSKWEASPVADMPIPWAFVALTYQSILRASFSVHWPYFVAALAITDTEYAKSGRVRIASHLNSPQYPCKALRSLAAGTSKASGRLSAITWWSSLTSSKRCLLTSFSQKCSGRGTGRRSVAE